MTMDNHAARKAAVYEAALQLIARGVSPAAMTIQQLADTAGIGKGTVYSYFSSKEEILQGLAEYCFARENERLRVLFADCRTLAGLEERMFFLFVLMSLNVAVSSFVPFLSVIRPASLNSLRTRP